MCKKTRTVKFKGRVIHKRVSILVGIYFEFRPQWEGCRVPTASTDLVAAAATPIIAKTRSPMSQVAVLPHQTNGSSAAAASSTTASSHPDIGEFWEIFIIIMVFGLKNLLACRYYFITFSPTSNSSLDLIFFVIQYANSSEISFHFSSYKSCEILRSMCENFIWIPSSKKTFTFNGWNIVRTYFLHI